MEGEESLAASAAFWLVVSALFLLLAIVAYRERRFVLSELEPFSRGKGHIRIGEDGVALGVEVDGKLHRVLLHRFLGRIFATMLVVEFVGFLAAMLAALVELLP